MPRQQRSNSLTQLDKLRNKAFDVGGPLGMTVARAADLCRVVAKQGIFNTETVSYSVESLKGELTLALSRDSLARSNPAHSLIYGLADAMGGVVESILGQLAAVTGGQTAAKIDSLDDTTSSTSTPSVSHVLSPLFGRIKEEPMDGDEEETALEETANEDPFSELDALARKEEEGERMTRQRRQPKRRRSSSSDEDEEYKPAAPAARRSRAAAATAATTEAETEFVCDPCGRVFTNKTSLAKHTTIMHDGEKCPYCKQGMAKGRLEAHVRSYHSHESRKRGDLSKVATPSANSASTSKIAASTPSTASAADTYAAEDSNTCETCDKTFETKAGLTMHALTHTGAQCKVCLNFMGKDRLAAHMNDKHPNSKSKRRPADETDETPNTAKSAASAAFSTTTSRTPRSAVAPSSSNASQSGKRAPAGLGSFACSKCDNSYTRAYDLKKHFEKKHGEE